MSVPPFEVMELAAEVDMETGVAAEATPPPIRGDATVPIKMTGRTMRSKYLFMIDLARVMGGKKWTFLAPGWSYESTTLVPLRGSRDSEWLQIELQTRCEAIQVD